MEEKHLLTEHLRPDMKRQCEAPVLDQARAVQERLSHKIGEELFRQHNPEYAKQHPRYRGICAALGNPVFSSTPVEPPSYLRPFETYGVTGFARPFQHPMYTTSNHQYGQQPSPGSFPIVHHPRDTVLTATQAIGGMYEDTHLTTELDSEATSG